MINRKIDEYLNNIFHLTKKALLVIGARQIGRLDLADLRA